MVSPQLLRTVDALNEDERIQLIAYIEGTFDVELEPTEKQKALVTQRDAELKANPELGISFEDAKAALRARIA